MAMPRRDAPHRDAPHQNVDVGVNFSYLATVLLLVIPNRGGWV